MKYVWIDDVVRECLAEIRHCLDLFTIKELNKREAYKALRETIKKALNKIEEIIKYGIQSQDSP